MLNLENSIKDGTINPMILNFVQTNSTSYCPDMLNDLSEFLFGEEKDNFRLNKETKLSKMTIEGLLQCFFEPLKSSFRQLKSLYKRLPLEKDDEDITKLYYDKIIDSADVLIKKVNSGMLWSDLQISSSFSQIKQR
jgi:hypothetical protein